MYQPDTILRLKEQREPIGKNSEGDEIPFPYNRVRVVGASPVNHAGIQSEWVGNNATGVVIEPLSSFGSNLDEPLGRVQDMYEVESVPDPVDLEIVPKVRVVGPESLGKSPEDHFSDVASGQGQDTRKVVPPVVKRSPLVDAGPTPEEVAAQEKVKRERLRRAGKTESPLDTTGTDGEATD